MTAAELIKENRRWSAQANLTKHYYYVAEMTDQNKHVCENMSKGKCLRQAARMTGFVE